VSALVAVLGGTFDPVHNAHLAIARRALGALRPQCIVWLPTGAPGYRAPPVASAADRVAMLRLAVADEPRYSLDERELAPGASGYTYDTLLQLRAERTGTEIVMLLGTDQFAKIQTWYRWRELFELARFAVFARSGWSAPALDVPPQAVIAVELPPLPISASDIRARIGRGEDVSAMLPAAVLAYIRAKGLYR
jgi:nicotinate-nucleotide adenylyltransferase